MTNEELNTALSSTPSRATPAIAAASISTRLAIMKFSAMA